MYQFIASTSSTNCTNLYRVSSACTHLCTGCNCTHSTNPAFFQQSLKADFISLCLFGCVYILHVCTLVHVHTHIHTCTYVKMLSTNKFSQQINHILYGKAKGSRRVVQKRSRQKRKERGSERGGGRASLHRKKNNLGEENKQEAERKS